MEAFYDGSFQSSNRILRYFQVLFKWNLFWFDFNDSTSQTLIKVTVTVFTLRTKTQTFIQIESQTVSSKLEKNSFLCVIFYSLVGILWMAPSWTSQVLFIQQFNSIQFIAQQQQPSFHLMICNICCLCVCWIIFYQ